MVNNGSLHYDHDRDGTHTQLAGCEAKMRNVDHDTHIAIRYEYDTVTGNFEIFMYQLRYKVIRVCESRNTSCFTIIPNYIN